MVEDKRTLKAEVLEAMLTYSGDVAQDGIRALVSVFPEGSRALRLISYFC